MPRDWPATWRRVDSRWGPMVVNRHDHYIGRSLMHYGEFSRDEADRLRSLVQPGAWVVEVGANIGALTLPLLDAVGPEGFVMAFEPQPEVREILRANVSRYGGQVEVRPEACGPAEGVLYLPPIAYDRPGNFGGVELSGEGSRPVRVMPLDNLLLPRLDLLKIDAEGMETEVLMGARDLITRHGPILYVEDDRPEHRAALHDALRFLGYRWEQHHPRLFSPRNHFGNQHNLFPGIVSMNLLCRPV